MSPPHTHTHCKCFLVFKIKGSNSSDTGPKYSIYSSHVTWVGCLAIPVIHNSTKNVILLTICASCHGIPHLFKSFSTVQLAVKHKLRKVYDIHPSDWTENTTSTYLPTLPYSVGGGNIMLQILLWPFCSIYKTIETINISTWANKFQLKNRHSPGTWQITLN